MSGWVCYPVCAGLKSRTRGGVGVGEAAASEKAKNGEFLQAFFGGKLRPRRDAWARMRSYARSYVRGKPRRGSPNPPGQKSLRRRANRPRDPSCARNFPLWEITGGPGAAVCIEATAPAGRRYFPFDFPFSDNLAVNSIRRKPLELLRFGNYANGNIHGKITRAKDVHSFHGIHSFESSGSDVGIWVGPEITSCFITHRSTPVVGR